MDNRTKVVMEQSDKVLEIIDNREFNEMTRGDLQGVIEAIISKAYYEGKADGLAEAIEKLEVKNINMKKGKIEQKIINKWILTNRGNYVLNGSNFHISYSDVVRNGICGISFFASDDRSNETALCKNGKYYILNGDFRKDYEKLINKGFNACYKFYLSKKNKYDSSWSTDNY